MPARHNPRLLALADRINADDELRQFWRCANVNAVDRLNLGDCGEVHVRIVANAALKLLRLLRDGAMAAQQRLTPDDAEVVVVLAAALHDLGLAVHAEAASAAGLALAALKGRELLAGLYPVRERTILLSETLHAVAALDAATRCLTLEAGVLRLADALDLTKGRVRLSPDGGRGAAGPPQVEDVTIQRSHQPPVRVIIRLVQAEGVAGLDAFLHARLRDCRLEGLVEILARLDGAKADHAVWLNPWSSTADR